jgi:molybdopterin-guanine dinucleotide biosynthesis protein A
MDERKYTGIVLAGGKSSRMGRNKGLITWEGQTLAEHAIHALLPLCKTIIISANDRSYDFLDHRRVADRYEDCGPMGGILSCLEQSGTEINLVIPVDTPNVKTWIYEHLLQNTCDYDMIVPLDHDSWYQPLCAIYNRTIIPAMEKQISDGILGFTPLIRKVNSKEVPFRLNGGLYNEHTFLNINSPEDLGIIS